MSTILLVHTSAIHCFHNLAEQLAEDGLHITDSWNLDSLKEALDAKPYDAILINLEPDGSGGIQGIDELNVIRTAPKQQNAICFAISVSSTVTLLDVREMYQPTLSIIAGWIDLPVQAKKSSKIIHDVIRSSGQLSIGQRSKSSGK